MHQLLWDDFRPVVSHANRLPCPPGFVFGPRIIFDHQFIFVASGKGIASIGGREYEAKAGDLFYYGPDVVHRFQADAEDPYVIYGLHFSLDMPLPPSGTLLTAQTMDIDEAFFEGQADSALALCGDAVDEKLVVPERCHPGVAWTEPYFKRIAGTFGERQSKLANLGNRSLLIQFMLELQDRLRHAGNGTAGPTELLREVRERLKQHADQPYDRAWLAEWTSYHENHAARLFHQAFGMTPHHYFLQQKMDLAVDLLLSTEAPIGEIADKLNAGTIHYFSRTFKKHTGQPPAEYRKTRRRI